MEIINGVDIEEGSVITGSTIDNTPIGQTTPAAGSFTTLTASTDPTDGDGVGDQGFNDLRYALKDLSATTSADPALNAAVSTVIIDAYGGVIITLTGAGNAQTLQSPTDTAAIKRFIVVTDDGNGAYTIEVNGITMSAGEAQWFIWDGSAWVTITAIDADDMAFTPTGNIVATNVQSAIAEVDNEKVAKIASVDNEIARFNSTGGEIQGYTSGAPTISDVGVTALKNELNVVQEAISGTDNQTIDVSVGETLEAEEHWTGIRIKPDNLDPSGADTRIRGMAINLENVDLSNIPESMECLSLVTPAGLTGPARVATDALRIVNGDVNHTFDIPATAGENFTAYDLIAGVENLHANSCALALDVVTSGGVPAGCVSAIGTHAYVKPIHQSLGTYSVPSQTEFVGRKTGGGATWADGVDGIEVFVANGDEVYVGGAVQFSELELVLTTPATKTVTPTFWYNTAADTWVQFYPEDTTDGFQQNGLIHWQLDNISASWTGNGDPGAGDTTAGYWIKIIRTAGPDPGTPTPTTLKTGIVTLYSWDENGDLDVRGLKVAGTIELNEQAILIDVVLATDHSWTGPVQTITAGENLAIFETAYLKSDGKYWKTDGSAAATAISKIVMATAAINADASGIGLLPSPLSFIRDDSTSKWTFAAIGKPLFFSLTGGELVEDTSGHTTTNDIVRVAGYMETATVLNFDAAKTWITIS